MLRRIANRGQQLNLTGDSKYMKIVKDVKCSIHDDDNELYGAILRTSINERVVCMYDVSVDDDEQQLRALDGNRVRTNGVDE